MKCLFCKKNSKNNISKEHIVPESLGNEDHILPPGWVCDDCNNYFSRKVEAPFLNSQYGKSARFDMKIPSKKRRVPIGNGFHPQSRTKVDLQFRENGLNFCAADGEDEAHFIESIRTQKHGSLYIPKARDPEPNYIISRFIGKVALEILAYKYIDVSGWNDELVNKPELDELRDYVRRGKPGFIWPVHIRRIYPAEYQFSSDPNEEYQVLHEWDILYIQADEESNGGEFYAIIAILGIEYAINLGGPELEGYIRWLKTNNNKIYLYSGKNAY